MQSILPLLIIFSIILSGSFGVSAEMNLPKPASKMPTTQIIVKFKDPKLDPSIGTYLYTLSTEAGVSIIYVRARSGDAHVLRIEAVDDAESLHRILARIAARSDVQWVEQDVIMRHQSR